MTSLSRAACHSWACPASTRGASTRSAASSAPPANCRSVAGHASGSVLHMAPWRIRSALLLVRIFTSHHAGSGGHGLLAAPFLPQLSYCAAHLPTVPSCPIQLQVVEDKDDLLATPFLPQLPCSAVHPPIRAAPSNRRWFRARTTRWLRRPDQCLLSSLDAAAHPPAV